jgi:hypothetical protein
VGQMGEDSGDGRAGAGEEMSLSGWSIVSAA